MAGAAEAAASTILSLCYNSWVVAHGRMGQIKKNKKGGGCAISVGDITALRSRRGIDPRTLL